MNKNNTLGAISTCKQGEEKYVYFNRTPRPRRNGKDRYCNYEWRDPADGSLFNCVKPTLERCREERDKWLQNKS